MCHQACPAGHSADPALAPVSRTKRDTKGQCMIGFSVCFLPPGAWACDRVLRMEIEGRSSRSCCCRSWLEIRRDCDVTVTPSCCCQHANTGWLRGQLSSALAASTGYNLVRHSSYLFVLQHIDYNFEFEFAVHVQNA